MTVQHTITTSVEATLAAPLTQVLRRFTIPEHAKRIIMNCRQTSYYRIRQGLTPMELQLVRHSAMDVWHIVMMASFTYPHQQSSSLELDLYFHLPNGWCYQADVGSASLAHDEVQTLLSVWTTSFARHLARRAFDEITVSVITTQ
ncbi:DUF2787 family protein [Vibrio cincinnatiensis]|uniref:DUF2787 family protein n=1 Tax=Vibrio cincinnatiensis TaxID=675 RepID=UPI001EE0378A|nr:DUF2787 family protein [Vibrio cincinnatiensis]MCG3728106.1 DUF2787 domain-containing protein [Vibrio cincinnatiensis]